MQEIKKCEYLINELNFDHVINYKEQNVFKEIKETCPEGVNVYFDNVGGKIADDVISNIAPFARIGVCGVISQYNLTQAELGQEFNVQYSQTKPLLKVFSV